MPILKDLSQIISEPPMICGDFKNIGQAAEYVSSTPHSILLDGYLLYAYKGKDTIRSIIITTGYSYGKMMISIVYDGYKMIYVGLTTDGLNSFISELKDDKKLNKIYSSLISRFYGEIEDKGI